MLSISTSIQCIEICNNGTVKTLSYVSQTVCAKYTNICRTHVNVGLILHVFYVQGYTPDCIRVWPFEKRSNNTTRPGYLEKLDDPTITVMFLAMYTEYTHTNIFFKGGGRGAIRPP